MPHITSDGSSIRVNRWRQGSILLTNDDDLPDKSGCFLKKNSRYILISQDCDIANVIEKEPFIELIAIEIIDKIDGNCVHGKNPRILHLIVQDGNAQDVHIKCVAYEKLIVSKEHLMVLKPDGSISIQGDNLVLLCNWLSNRYSRAAFPDEFNRRLRKNKMNDKLAKVMGKFGKNVKSIMVKLYPFEEIKINEDSYKLTILFLIDTNHYENVEAMTEVDNCFEQMITLLKNINGIDVVDSESKVRSTDDITLHEYMRYFKWDMDYLSYSDGDADQVLPAANQL